MFWIHCFILSYIVIYTQFQWLEFKLDSKVTVFNIFFSILKDSGGVEFTRKGINGIGRQMDSRMLGDLRRVQKSTRKISRIRKLK